MIKLRRANPQSQGLQPQGCQSQGFQDPGHQPSAPPYQPPVQVQASDNAYTRFGGKMSNVKKKTHLNQKLPLPVPRRSNINDDFGRWEEYTRRVGSTILQKQGF